MAIRTRGDELPFRYGLVTEEISKSARLLGQITGIKTEGTTTILSGNSGVGGSLGGPYFVLASTNLTLSLTNWTPLSTNLFVGAGNFSVTNEVDPAQPQLFYLLQVP